MFRCLVNKFSSRNLRHLNWPTVYNLRKHGLIYEILNLSDRHTRHDEKGVENGTGGDPMA
jgi:hypothetical protein